jgi:hypothetical protein
MLYRNSQTIRHIVKKNGHLPVATILFAAIASLLAASPAAQACNIYFVSVNNGNDTNAGTFAKPWKTIAKAAAQNLHPCDTIYVRAGTYKEHSLFFSGSGTATQPITISAYPGETPVLNGTGLNLGQWTEFFSLTGSYITLNGFTLYNGGVGVETDGPYTTVSNMNISYTLQQGIIAKGDYTVIKNNIVSYASQYFLSNKSSGWANGIDVCCDPVDGVTSNAILQGNTVFATAGEGIITDQANGTIFDSNIVYDNWATNTYICDSQNVIFRNNLVYTTTLSDTLWGRRAPLLSLADEVASVPRSANNVVINNMFLTGEGVVAVSAFSWTEVTGSGLTSALIANNTLVNGEIDTGPINTASHIENNIVYRNDGGVMGSVPTGAGLTFSNNLWYPTRPSNATGAGDVIANPKLALTGTVGPGKVATGYFAVPSSSPAKGKGAAIYYVTGDYLISSSTAPNIGAYTTNPPISYLK